MSKSAQTQARQVDHIDIVLKQNVTAKGVTTGFERYFFEHQALLGLDLDEIDTSLSLFGKRLKTPLLISSMTGGADLTRAINLHLAEAPRASARVRTALNDFIG